MITRRRHEAELDRLSVSYRESVADVSEAARASSEVAKNIARDNQILSDRLVAVLDLLDAMPENATTISIRRVRVAATGLAVTR